jgi:hypothetical protein
MDTGGAAGRGGDFPSASALLNLTSLGHGRLTVRFTDGNEATYEHISVRDFLAFLNAPSIGFFYNRIVNGKWG